MVQSLPLSLAHGSHCNLIGSPQGQQEKLSNNIVTVLSNHNSGIF